MGPGPGGPRGTCHRPSSCPRLCPWLGPRRPHLVAGVLPVLVLVLLLVATQPPAGAAKPMALASPDQVLENMKQIPQWHCLRYRKFDLVTQHKRCRHFRVDRKH